MKKRLALTLAAVALTTSLLTVVLALPVAADPAGVYVWDGRLAGSSTPTSAYVWDGRLAGSSTPTSAYVDGRLAGSSTPTSPLSGTADWQASAAPWLLRVG